MNLAQQPAFTYVSAEEQENSRTPEEILAFLDQLHHQVDLGPIAYTLMYPAQGEGWSLETTRYAIRQYQGFLLGHFLYPDRAMQPSQLVDKLWHIHILDTRKYREDCDRLFAHILDHFPYHNQE